MTLEELINKHYYYEIDLLYLAETIKGSRNLLLKPDLLEDFPGYDEIVRYYEHVIENIVKKMLIEVDNKDMFASSMYFLNEKEVIK